jgi:hypothetical protein
MHDIALKESKSNHNVFIVSFKNLPIRDSGNLNSSFFENLLNFRNNQYYLKEKLKNTKNLQNICFSYVSKATKVRIWSIFPKRFKYRLIDVKDFAFDGFRFGNAILASLSSFYQIGSTPNTKFSFFTIYKCIKSYICVYLKTLDFLTTHKIKCVYVFNGRLLNEKAVINACKKLEVQFFTYEIAEGGQHYSIVDGEILNNKDFCTFSENLYTQKYTIQDKSAVEDWYENKKNKSTTFYPEFLSNFQTGYVDLDIMAHKKTKKIMTFFSGSTDELMFLDSFETDIFPTQESAFSILYDRCKDSNNLIQVVVRTHPRMRFRPKIEQLEWSNFLKKFENIIEIPSESPVDSYTLLNLSDYVSVYKSTIGIESLRLSKPTLILGQAHYIHLPGIRPVKNASDIDNFLKAPYPENCDLASDIYGFYHTSLKIKLSKNFLDKKNYSYKDDLLKVESFIFLREIQFLHFIVNYRLYLKNFTQLFRFVFINKIKFFSF